MAAKTRVALSIIAIAAFVLGGFVLPKTAIATSPTSLPLLIAPPSERGPDRGWEVNWEIKRNRILELVNEVRTERGCAPLSRDSRLDWAAQQHSYDMAWRNYFSHTNPEGNNAGRRMSAAGYPVSYWGENIAAGWHDPDVVMRKWMNSSGHRANILNCIYRNIGIGLAYGGTYGVYWTQNFASPTS